MFDNEEMNDDDTAGFDDNEKACRAGDASETPEGGELPGATATYSPEDNKLRLYSPTRLDAELYARVKAAGFKWAPRQQLFVAPMWTPDRADLLIELCGDIGDEDTSLVDRAEERAERFGEYRENRIEDAEAAKAAVDRIADGIPMGQPILVGHHSEKHARKDAEKIKAGMRRAVKMWETAEYWKRRAAGAIRHAKYKELPAVRARRIKGLEADKRKQEKIIAQSEKYLRAWSTPDLTRKQATFLANYDHQNLPATPEKPYGTSLWSELEEGRMDAGAAAALAKARHERNIAYHRKWLQHVELRLTYERAMLGETGGTVADKTGPEKGGAVRCWASRRGGWSYIQKVNKVSVTILDNWDNGGPNFKRTIEFDKLTAVMTAAQVEEARAAGRIVELPNGIGFHLREPGDETSQPETRDEMHERQHREAVAAAEAEKRADEERRASFGAMRDSLKVGVVVVSAPQLFPTPPDTAEYLVAKLHVREHHSVLEPSAGTGNIVRAMLEAQPRDVTAIEINAQLAEQLRRQFPSVNVRCHDFLTGPMYGRFDRIGMNPPFADGQDVEHVTHAFGWLADGGRLVAVMSAGTKFRKDKKTKAFRAFVESVGGEIEDLPEDSFKESGTSVRTVLVTLEKE